MGAAKGVLRSADVEVAPAMGVLRVKSAKWRVSASRALYWVELGFTAVAVLLATLLGSAEWGVVRLVGLAAGGGLRQYAAGRTYRKRRGAGTLHKRLEHDREDLRMPVAGSHAASYSRVQHASRNIPHMQGWAPSLLSHISCASQQHRWCPCHDLSSYSRRGTPRHCRCAGPLREPTPLHVHLSERRNVATQYTNNLTWPPGVLPWKKAGGSRSGLV